jgi:hypothetical protein
MVSSRVLVAVVPADSAADARGCNPRDTARAGGRPHPRLGGIDAALTTTPSTKWRRRPHPDPATGRIPPTARAQESRSMIRQTGLPSTETDVEDRSMRLVEYVMAFVAVVAAGVLAFLR